MKFLPAHWRLLLGLEGQETNSEVESHKQAKTPSKTQAQSKKSSPEKSGDKKSGDKKSGKRKIDERKSGKQAHRRKG